MLFPTLAVLLGVSVAFASPLFIVQDVDEVANPEICGNSLSNDVADGAEMQFASTLERTMLSSMFTSTSSVRTTHRR